MSKPRRGLLATGLAVAVVGALGIVSTLDASAGQTPGGGQAPGAGGAIVPPKLLPWGDPPTKIKMARPGVDSAAVAAAGAAAAAADTSGSLIPVPKYAPKGGISKTDVLKQEQTAVAAQAAETAAAAAAVYYLYAEARQTGDTDGTWANLPVTKPELAVADYHSLTEIAVRSADYQQVVEVGWTVDRAVNNGDADPHLFVYRWTDGAPGCYNGCGFVPYSGSTVKPGDTLPAGTLKRFGIQHSGTVWWIAYNSEWIGYFPDSLWGGKYTRGGSTHWFGEVAAATTKPCTDMGNGVIASDPKAATVDTITLTNGPTPKVELVNTTSTLYSVALPDPAKPPADTFRYGGPGSGKC